MVGGFLFKLTAKKVQYEFVIKRKITRVTGESATGKSELVRVLADAENPRSGITVACKYTCRVLTDDAFRAVNEDILNACGMTANHSSAGFYDTMRNMLGRYDNCLFFADEDFSFLGTEAFALFCKFTDSFFVFFCRDPLHKLPYSYTEIYNMKTSGKYHTLVSIYHTTDFSYIYEERRMVIEDSHAGYEFFAHFYDKVTSADGKSKIVGLIERMKENIMVVADGAAFGSEIEMLLGSISRHGADVKVFLPESFEWLVLASDLFMDDFVNEDILNPVQRVTGLYFSWERYFTEVLMRLSSGFENTYSKRHLNKCYYLPCCCKRSQNCNLVFTAKKKQAILGHYLNKTDSGKTDLASVQR